MEIDKEYLVLETMYEHKYNDNNPFPREWYNVYEYDLKKEILKECLYNNIQIMDSSLYYDFKLRALNEKEEE